MANYSLGEVMPGFTLPAVSGEEFSFEGQKETAKGWHLLIFFRGSWCSACIKALKDLELNKAYFEDEAIHLITVSTDNLTDLTNMSEELQLSFPVLADESFSLLNQYAVYLHGEDAPYEDTGIHGEPAYFLMDEEGKLLYQQRQTSPYGRPTADGLQQIIRFIKKKLQPT